MRTHWARVLKQSGQRSLEAHFLPLPQGAAHPTLSPQTFTQGSKHRAPQKGNASVLCSHRTIPWGHGVLCAYDLPHMPSRQRPRGDLPHPPPLSAPQCGSSLCPSPSLACRWSCCLQGPLLLVQNGHSPYPCCSILLPIFTILLYLCSIVSLFFFS